MSPTRRLSSVAALATAAALSASLSLAPTLSASAEPGPSSAEGSTVAAKKLTSTRFAFRGNGYGTSARGGELPVDSSRTALSSIACTSLAGKKNRNFVEESEIDGLGTVRAAFSRTWTSQKKGVTAARSKHKVAEVVLADTPLGSLSISGVVSTTKASWSKKNGWQAKANTKLAGITLTPPIGEPQTFPIPSPGETITVPGVAAITLGRTIEKAEPAKGRSRAYAVGLSVKVIPTDTVVKIARSASKLEEGFKTGIFQGSAVPVKAKVLGELAQVGRVITQVMPCVGTGGELVRADAASVNIADQIVVDAASARQKGKQNNRKAVGTEVSRIASLNLGDGALVLDAIESKVKVTRLKNGRLKRSASAKVGSITGGEGEPQSLEELDGLEIPGLLKIETGLRKKVKDGIRMIGLRLTLLDGTGAVIDLATSKLSIADR